MSSGYPDWNNDDNSRGVYSSDVNDLAARLGALSRISRSGKLIYQTTWVDDYILWTPHGGGNASFVPTYDTGIYRPGCLAFAPGGEAAGTVDFSRYFPPVLGSTYGVEFSYLSLTNKNTHPGIQFIVFDGVYKWYYDFYLDYSDGIVYAPNASGGAAELAVLGAETMGSLSFSIIKMYIDTENHKYKRLQIQSRDIALNDVTPGSSVLVTQLTDLYVGITLTSESVFSSNAKFGHFVLTFGE